MRVRDVLALAVLLAGCGPAPREESQPPHVARIEPGTVTGAERAPPVDRPHDFRTFRSGTPPELPSYLPIFPGAKVRGGFQRPSRFGASGSVIFETPAEAGDVIAFYEKNAAAANFVPTPNASNGGTLTFGARAGRHTIQVIAEPIEGGSHVQIFWTGGD